MLGYGFDEIITSSLIGHNLANTYLQPLNIETCVKVLNQHSDDFSILRQMLNPNMLDVAKNNFDNGNKSFHYIFNKNI